MKNNNCQYLIFFTTQNAEGTPKLKSFALKILFKQNERRKIGN